ncbi:MAG: Glycosyl transferase [Candidatus Magasanikbacteria bacterium GW2011_GWA2_56_11]|uniref:Glycosyl transferase n=1 Tax=Candidatus Magasanikbacteria bacterium GW2011_GWA2_56_11 TaxID=1619044 RepID=A0A0G2AMU3_9BACT|nr:MAG: Glycosyl transferase [Candidatus Magasanikbacteria bacterium GW2011_GWA2_56_11]
MKTVVVVPVRDEADALERLLPRVGAQAGGATVVVVDDGSSDGSAEVARRHGVAVIGQRPLGKPAAVRCGFEYALAQDCDAAVVFDGDGQHPPEALPDMIGLLRSSDIVKGARFHPASPQIGTPDDRQELCRRIRDLVREHTGWVVHDPQCGFVGLRRPMIELVLSSLSWTVEWEIELIVWLRSRTVNGCPILELPIPAIYADLPGRKQAVKYDPAFSRARLQERFPRQARAVAEAAVRYLQLRTAEERP